MSMTLEDCLAKIARMQRQNGKGITRKQLVEEGLELLKGAMNENPAVFTKNELAKIFLDYGIVDNVAEGLNAFKGIHGKEISYGESGFFYFEEKGRRIVIGYSE